MARARRIVVGPGRSGSTFLDLRLAEAGVAALGEVCHVPERAAVLNELCGCGMTAHDCEFWSGVLFDAFGPDWLPVCVDLAARLSEQTRPRYLVPRLLGLTEQDDARTVRDLRKLYKAIEQNVGERDVWDSSKSPSYAALLVRTLPDTEVVGLTRDPRGVVYSWMTPKARPEANGTLMPSHGVWGGIARWMYGTVGARLLNAKRRIDYRDLGNLDAASLNLETAPGQWTHSIGGNPVRFDGGSRRFRPDERWRTAMPIRDRVLVTVSCWPLFRLR